MFFRVLSGYGLPIQSFQSPLGYGQARASRGASFSESARYVLANMIPPNISHTNQSLSQEVGKVSTISELDYMSEANLLIPISRVSSSFSRRVVTITEGSSSYEWLQPNSLLPWILPDRIPHTEPEDTPPSYPYSVYTPSTSNVPKGTDSKPRD